MSDQHNRVLVVDDTPSKRYVLGSWLRRAGYAVTEAATGAEALAAFGRGGIDLVVLDVQLPDMSGFDVCEQIKGDPVYGTTPVIHVSAAAIHSVDRTRGLTRGADAYLVEPIDPDEMLATVAAILRYYQARIQAERLAERLANLAAVTVTMGATTDLRTLLHEAAAGASLIFSTSAAINAVAGDGTRLVAMCTAPGRPTQLSPSDADFGEARVGVTFADFPAQRWPQFGAPPESTIRVLTVRPRVDQDAIYVAVPTAAAVDAAPVLTLFGKALMSAVDAMRLYDEEHDLALTLQRSLLPRGVVHLPEMDIAVRYVPASDRAEIGGDFYEVVRFDDAVMIAVGDVGGHSLHAATIMAELRHATRAYLADGHGPAGVVDRLNRLMMRMIPGEIATLCLLSVDIRTGAVRLANAGHPPPVWCPASGPRMMKGHSPLLGIQAAPAVEIEFTLGVGDTLVLYTDGLIETQEEPIDHSFARLTAACQRIETDLETFASRLLTEVGPAEPGDDIAMVVLRRAARKF
ncbi:MAG TPA: fused response regulator/phosphatase [Micromonosporaceae bacterium]|jgi:DNA-binding response OmpR family regulator